MQSDVIPLTLSLRYDLLNLSKRAKREGALERERDLICRSHCSGSMFLDQYSINQNWVRAQPHLAFSLPVGSSGSQRPDWQERIRCDFLYWQITGWNQQGKGLTHCKDTLKKRKKKKVSYSMCSFFWRYKIRKCLPVHLALKVSLKISN